MRPASLLVTFLFASTALAADPPPSSTAEVLARLRQLETAALKGEGLKHRDEFQQQIARSPRDWMLRVYAAWCAMPSDTSWNELKDVSLRAQDMAWPHVGMARIYLSWKMRDLADGELKIALKKVPGFYPALIVQGDAARTAGQHDAAIALYRQALLAADDPGARAGLGLSLNAQGRSAEARAELTRAVDAWPAQPEALAALADLAMAEKDAAAASRRYRQMLELSPKDKKARRALADLAFDGGDKATAAAEYLLIIEGGDTDAEVVRRLGTMVDQVRTSPSAERIFLKLADLEPNSAEPYRLLAELAEAQGDLERAEKRLIAAGRRAPKDVSVLVRLARLQTRRERYAEAVESYRAAQALGGAPPEAAAEVTALATKLMLPAAAPKGSLDRIHKQVSSSLNALYAERVKEEPDLSGILKVRVAIGEDGRAQAVDLVGDTVKDPLIAGHAYLALKDAQYPKQKREPTFEFDLKPARKGSR